MLKTFFLLLTLSLTVSISAQTAPSPTPAAPAAAVYTDSQNLYSVALPAGWQPVAEKQPAGEFKARVANELGAATVTIKSEKLEGSERLTAADYNREVLRVNPNQAADFARSVLPGSVVSSSGKMQLAGQEALFVIFDGPANENDPAGPTRFYFINTLFKGHLYFMAFYAPKKDFDKLSPAFREIIAGFQAMPPAGK